MWRMVSPLAKMMVWERFGRLPNTRLSCLCDTEKILVRTVLPLIDRG